MSIEQTTPEETSAGQILCTQCKAASPLRATFCSSCGERLKGQKQANNIDDQDPKNRYRITTLVRRRPYVNLYFALDNQQSLVTGQSRTVAIREVDVSHLQKDARAHAIEQIRLEYDQLRRWQIPHILTSVDLRLFQGRLSLISGLPVPGQNTSPTKSTPQRLYTLQDFLQSGQGLPAEARTLEWMGNLCQAVEKLHRRHIILGDLDPYTVILPRNGAEAEPNLMVFWLIPELQKLLPQFLHASNPQLSYFSAPEALAGKAEIRSDVYSLGALLYLLLTGTPPDESTLRHRRHLRTPREINPRISQHVDECVMQALAVEPADRFATVAALQAMLQASHLPKETHQDAELSANVPAGEAETVRIVPLSQRDVVRWRAAREEKHHRDELAAQKTRLMPSVDIAPPTATSPASTGQQPRGSKATPKKMPPLPTTPFPDVKMLLPEITRRGRHVAKSSNTPVPAPAPKIAWKKRITGLLPNLKSEEVVPEVTKTPAIQPPAEKRLRKTASAKKSISTALALTPPGDVSLLKQFQRLFLGEQQHKIEAAAIIETPIRIRPDQPYNLRIHIMGREEPTPHPDAHKGEAPAGLSALVHGEGIQVEVRSVLQQGYTYVLQQAPVSIPANGYVAEVTIPMQPQGGISTSMRNRLHIFFLDEQRHPLYEKPFVVEVYVSPLVQFGREGHQVLTIPL